MTTGHRHLLLSQYFDEHAGLVIRPRLIGPVYGSVFVAALNRSTYRDGVVPDDSTATLFDFA